MPANQTPQTATRRRCEGEIKPDSSMTLARLCTSSMMRKLTPVARMRRSAESWRLETLSEGTCGNPSASRIPPKKWCRPNPWLLKRVSDRTGLLGHRCVSDAERHAGGGRGFKRQVKSRHATRVDIDGQREPRSLDRLAG